jgi:hypothetical protein
MFAASKTDSASDGGYQIARSLRFNSADSAYLNRTPATATNRRTYTFSAWVKRSKSGDFRTIFSAATDTSNLTIIRFQDTTDKIEVRSATGGSTVFQLITTQVFRDYSAWYHFVLAVDTTNATGGDRVRLYVNGSEVTAFGTDTIPTQNADSWVNNNILHEIGRQANNASNYYQDGYMTEMYLVDGTQLTPSSFGETNAQTGVWQPKAYSGSYGTNGFYLNFSDNSNTTAATLGKDYSGNGNNWTPNNFSVTAGANNDSLVDSPTSYGTVDTGAGGEIRGNYCTINPISNVTGSSSVIVNGNLSHTGTSSANFLGTMASNTGKYYFEYLVTGVVGAPNIGAADASTFVMTSGFGGDAAGKSWGCYLATGQTSNAGTNGYSLGAFIVNHILGVAIDMDNQKIYFAKNNVWGNSGDPATGTNPAFSNLVGTIAPAFAQYASGDFNFGQRPFAYTAPSGFKALCTQNLPTPTIGATTATQAGKFFNAVTYTGTGSSLGVSGVGFQPDWVWAKSRSAATDHALYDAVRGVQKQLESNTNTAETTETTGLTAFGSDGFTTGALAQMNTSAATYVAWNWKANGSGSSNTAGSITSTVSASTTSGFSIVTYTGTGSNATVGHGLGVAPRMIIIRTRSTQNDWYVYNEDIGNTKYLSLNQTVAATSFNLWQSTSPTSTVFSLATDGTVNGNGITYVAYCFAEVAGYSKIGSYTGTGSLDSPFVYCGFRPAFVMIKNASVTQPWNIQDDARSTSNVVDNYLRPNTSDAEASGYAKMDFVSNGFKIRDSDAFVNGNGNTMIFMAFAENPFKYSLAR